MGGADAVNIRLRRLKKYRRIPASLSALPAAPNSKADSLGVSRSINKQNDVQSKSTGYGSIPINPIFSGMNIHLPAILMFTRRFWHTANTIIESQEKHKRKFGRMIIVLYVYLCIGENLLNGSCNSSSTIWIRAGRLWSRRTDNMSALKKNNQFRPPALPVHSSLINTKRTRCITPIQTWR